jgi:endonuclease I
MSGTMQRPICTRYTQRMGTTTASGAHSLMAQWEVFSIRHQMVQNSENAKWPDIPEPVGKCQSRSRAMLHERISICRTAYMDLWTCCETAATSKWNLKPRIQAMLKQWHHLDPVSSQEAARNEHIVQKFQSNRNPFIDHPEWVDYIKGCSMDSFSDMHISIRMSSRRV